MECITGYHCIAFHSRFSRLQVGSSVKWGVWNLSSWICLKHSLICSSVAVNYMHKALDSTSKGKNLFENENMTRPWTLKMRSFCLQGHWARMLSGQEIFQRLDGGCLSQWQSQWMKLIGAFCLLRWFICLSEEMFITEPISKDLGSKQWGLARN